jgi:hypothetical protein
MKRSPVKLPPALRPALAFALLLLCAAAAPAAAQVKRLVVLKVDGLPHGQVEKFVRERDPRTGKSRLPWIDHLFYQGGTRVENFYTRGMSLSGPSWSLLDTGQHLQIKGNAEFDRFTLHTYDYLNFIPFWISNVGGQRIDMPGPETLDEVGIPLLADAYPYTERYLSFQLYQRGLRWTTLQRGIQNRFTSRSPGDLFNEWNIGFEARSMLFEQMERELIQKLADPRVRYLDFYTTDFDHAAHHNRDRESQLSALRDLDALVGRVWAAARKAPLADETALVLVSDHGINSTDSVYSQGYNLVKLLASAAGGGHHVVTKRRLLNDYALKGIYPLIPLIYTTTEETYYLRGQSTSYPTALVDFDGNERASVHLRDSDLNVLHILLQQLQRKDLAPDVRRAATDYFFATVERRRAGWQRTLEEVREELGALHGVVESQRAVVESRPKKFTKEEQDRGLHHEATRERARLSSWTNDELEYTAYADSLARLLALRPEGFDPQGLRIPDLIPAGAMGEQNSVGELQSYVVGPSPLGLLLGSDGKLDERRSFVRVDYYKLLATRSVRNNVQAAVESRPVDFVAARIPARDFGDALAADGGAEQVVWLHGSDERQALLLSRRDEAGRTLLRYLPVAGLRQDAERRVTFRRAGFAAGFPLKIWEDTGLELPAGASRESWLAGWHTDEEWLRAAHRTRYSNAVVGLHEQLCMHAAEGIDFAAPGLSDEERLLRRFRFRQRRLVEADLLVLANDHWNFDVRGFNPGGNHGSFFRVSTHSTLMFWGGERTQIPRGRAVEDPYDSLSLIPTLLAMTGQLDAEGRPAPDLRRKGFRPFPGRVIRDLVPARKQDAPVQARDVESVEK